MPGPESDAGQAPKTGAEQTEQQAKKSPEPEKADWMGELLGAAQKPDHVPSAEEYLVDSLFEELPIISNDDNDNAIERGTIAKK